MIERMTQSEFTVALALSFAFISSIGLMALARIGIPRIELIAGNTVRRILTNSAVPIAAQLFNRAVDLVFAAFVLRMLGANGNGQYAVATTVWLYAKTISDFGLGVLVTREVSRHPDQAGTLWLFDVAPARRLVIADPSRWPVSLLGIQLVRSVAHERRRDRVAGPRHRSKQLHGGRELNLQWARTDGVSGPAEHPDELLSGWIRSCRAVQRDGRRWPRGSGVVATTLSAIAFHLSARHLDVRPVWKLGMSQARMLVHISWPLLFNALLLNLFFRADVFIIQASQGDTALGSYDAAYKFINMLPLIPAYFTLAAFPLLSRYAASNSERLIDSYRLAAKLLFIVAWPITIGTMILAPDLIRVLAGESYLPNSAIALRILIWFLPISYVNGITQYVLIAVNRQRTITIAFAMAVSFNLGANLVLVPMYGYVAAAAVTIATEVVLFVPLSISVRRYVGEFNWVGFAVRPLLAAAAMGLAEVLSLRFGVIPALLIALATYALALVGTGTLGRREAEIALSVIGRSRPAVSRT